MDPNTYCQQKSTASGSNFTLSFGLLNKQRRQALQAVYAFCREVDDIVDNHKTPDIARIQLAWWHQAVDEIVSSPQHPICQALAPVIEEYQIPLTYFHDIISGMEMDLTTTIYEDELALSRYCYHAAGAVGLIVIRILGYEDPQTEDFAKQLGEVLQRINILRDIPEDARRGRVYIPVPVLVDYQLSPQLLLSGNWNDEERQQLVKMIIDQATSLKIRYQRAIATLPEVDHQKQRISLIMAAVYYRLLTKLAQRPARVLSGEKIKLGRLEKLWVVISSYFSPKMY